jgi:hypothetical protein
MRAAFLLTFLFGGATQVGVVHRPRLVRRAGGPAVDNLAEPRSRKRHRPGVRDRHPPLGLGREGGRAVAGAGQHGSMESF